MHVVHLLPIASPTHLLIASAIEQECYDNPWTRGDFRDYLASKGAHGYLGVTDECLPVGFVVLSLLRGRLNLHNLAVDPELHRRGAGSLILQAVLALHEAKTARSVVHEAELQSQLFLQKNGFRWVRTSHRRRADFYTMDWRVPAPNARLGELLAPLEKN